MPDRTGTTQKAHGFLSNITWDWAVCLLVLNGVCGFKENYDTNYTTKQKRRRDLVSQERQHLPMTPTSLMCKPFSDARTRSRGLSPI